MLEINANYSRGEVIVYSLPVIQMQSKENGCTGDSILIIPAISGGNGQITYTWTGPAGFASNARELLFHPVSNAESGIYTLQVEDTMYCKKSQTVELSITPAPVIAFAPYDTLWIE